MENIKLYHGNCLEVMDNIEDKSIDLLVTDPPYLHAKSGSNCKRVNRGVYDKNNEIKAKLSNFNEEQIFSFLEKVKKKMRKMNAYIFCSRLQIISYLKWVDRYKKYKYDLLIWDKCKSGLIGHKAFATNVEYIIRIFENGCGLKEVKKDGKLISEYYQKIQRIKPIRDKLHPAEKPEELLKRLILLSSNIDDVILDPFMGSGSTGVACVNTNRKFIGVELDEKYFNIAEERINNLGNILD